MMVFWLADATGVALVGVLLRRRSRMRGREGKSGEDWKDGMRSENW